MAVVGIYRTKTPATGAEYAFVDYGYNISLGEIPRSQYETQGYKPYFDNLPTKEKYEESKNAQSGEGAKP